jgi:hypothetical protein
VLLAVQVEEVIPLSETVDNYIHFLPNLRHQFSPQNPLNVPSASIILLYRSMPRHLDYTSAR